MTVSLVNLESVFVNFVNFYFFFFFFGIFWMSADSILGLQEELQQSPKKRVTFSPKIAVKTPQKPKDSTFSGIPQSFFRGVNVFIQINDRAIKRLLTLAMSKSGAVVLEDSSLFADYIISDKQINIVSPSINRSRGSVMLKSINVEKKIPKLILIQQIPWVFAYVPRLEGENIAIPDYASDIIKQIEFQNSKKNMMIVADIDSRFRPNVQVMKNIPKLYFGDVPRGYTLSPFEKLPLDFEPEMERIRARLKPRTEESYQRGPSDNSYCDLCSCSFRNAEEHHCSQEHKYHTNSEEWLDFDELSAFITNKKFFVGLEKE